MNGNDEKEVFIELEGLVVKLRKLRERTQPETRLRYFSVVITLVEQATAFYAYYIMGVKVYNSGKGESK